MLVTVIRSYSPEVVELPDGNLLRPFKFVEYTKLPESMKVDSEDGEKSALEKLVDAGLVKVAQIQDIGHLMVEGSAENRLPQSVTGQYVPAAGAVTPDEQRRVEERDKDKPKDVTENSKPALLSADEAARSDQYRTPTDELVASKVSMAQRARGADPEDDKSTVRLSEGAALQAGSAEGGDSVDGVKTTFPNRPTGPATA